MSYPFTITSDVRLRDVSVVDSCNCCCFGTRGASMPRNVYVHSSGEISVFDPAKAENEREALKRSVSNLQKIINQILEQRQRDKEEVFEYIDRQIVSLNTEEPTHITFTEVSDILDYIYQKKERKRF